MLVAALACFCINFACVFAAATSFGMLFTSFCTVGTFSVDLLHAFLRRRPVLASFLSAFSSVGRFLRFARFRGAGMFLRAFR
jgi:hypothetical protein